jgi:riboflavin kinase
MPELESPVDVGADELAALKLLGLRGAVGRDVKVSCGDLAEALGTSDQTVSRRLQELERDDLIEREMVADGQWVAVTERGETALRSEYQDYRAIFETDEALELTGTIESGMGEGEYYIALDGYQRQFQDKLGYSPFPGTLNLALDEESTRARSALDRPDGILIEEWENDERTFGAVTCYPATIGGVDGHVIEPHRSHYPDDMLELIAPVKLVDELGVGDGDELTVEVTEP